VYFQISTLATAAHFTDVQWL